MIEKKFELNLSKVLTGNILDIGGGGEGIIGSIYKEQVTAIDLTMDKGKHLDSKHNYNKMFMDARNLDFIDNSFQNVTFFYSLMYMDSDTQKKAIREAVRVTKINGGIHIWDIDCSNLHPNPITADLNINICGKSRSVTYMVFKNEDNKKDNIINILRENNIYITHIEYDGKYYYIDAIKKK